MTVHDLFGEAGAAALGLHSATSPASSLTPRPQRPCGRQASPPSRPTCATSTTPRSPTGSGGCSPQPLASSVGDHRGIAPDDIDGFVARNVGQLRRWSATFLTRSRRDGAPDSAVAGREKRLDCGDVCRAPRVGGDQHSGDELRRRQVPVTLDVVRGHFGGNEQDSTARNANVARGQELAAQLAGVGSPRHRPTQRDDSVAPTLAETLQSGQERGIWLGTGREWLLARQPANRSDMWARRNLRRRSKVLEVRHAGPLSHRNGCATDLNSRPRRTP